MDAILTRRPLTRDKPYSADVSICRSCVRCRWQKYLIDRFYDGTESGQLIYTTHDTCLLDKSYMRRDQVWFVEKNDRGESSLFSLSEFKVRNDRSFEKDYLGGVYGAIPILKDFSFTEV